MTVVELPISKSIANRMLILQAMHGDPLLEVTDAMPQDVVLLHDAIVSINSQRQTMGHNETALPSQFSTINLNNAGTAFRFLTAYCAQLPGCEVILDGCERMHHRPIGPLVDALRSLGATITYMGKEGFPPLHISGTNLHRTPDTKHQTPVTIHGAVSSQFSSALELIGIPCDAPVSPYLDMTRSLIACYRPSGAPYTKHLEPDWSSAAFWYEYVAIHGGEIELQGLCRDSLQGDKVVAELFEALGVHTLYTDAGVRVRGRSFSVDNTLNTKHQTPDTGHKPLNIDFSACPDLYPPVAMACKVLGYRLWVAGIENLRYKESDRIASVEAMVTTPEGQQVITQHDHRIAMAAMVAGYKVDDEDCVRKSYPNFKNELCKLLSLAEV